MRGQQKCPCLDCCHGWLIDLGQGLLRCLPEAVPSVKMADQKAGALGRDLCRTSEPPWAHPSWASWG